MDATFNSYIQNPMGYANSVISNREMYRSLYTGKLDKILVREAGDVKYKLYTSGKNYIAYLKIPSEVVDKFYYDVLIEFRPPKSGITGASLSSYLVRFYSNDPSFVFTFAHAFMKNDMFMKQLSSKMSHEAITKVAKEKNPKNQVGYVKSLYFAYLIMTKKGLFNKIRYTEKYDANNVMSSIMQADDKIKLRQEAQKKISAQVKKAKVVVNRQISDVLQRDLPTNSYSLKHAKKIKTIGPKAKKTGNTFIKSTKRV